jgi:hypothetical protein
MKLFKLAVVSMGILVVLAGCATTCPSCQPLPATGRYGVCAATGVGAKHLQVGDKIEIGRIGNVTNVSLVPQKGARTELALFQGSRGLVGWLARGDQGHDNHVVMIATVKVPRDATSCNKGTDVIRVDFVEPDSDGAYRGSRSSPDYGHIHAQIE